MHPLFTAESLLDLTHQPLYLELNPVAPAWDVLSRLPELCAAIEPRMDGQTMGEPWIGPKVFIGTGTIVEPGAVIKGPAWIGENCVIRTGCYIREQVVVGNGVMLGNSCEFKNCVLFDHAEIPHFNYVGDSVVGHKGHLGAGVILSNVRLDRQQVKVALPDGSRVETGLRKFGAIIGDHAEIGCNAVLNPGSVIGRDAVIYPGTPWQGYLAERGLVQYQPTVRVRTRP